MFNILFRLWSNALQDCATTENITMINNTILQEEPPSILISESEDYTATKNTISCLELAESSTVEFTLWHFG